MAYLLTLDAEDMPMAVADAVSTASPQELDQNLDYLSSTPIQLAAIVSRWHSEQRRSGYIKDMESAIDLQKLDRLRQILGPYLQKH